MDSPANSLPSSTPVTAQAQAPTPTQEEKCARILELLRAKKGLRTITQEVFPTALITDFFIDDSVVRQTLRAAGVDVAQNSDGDWQLYSLQNVPAWVAEAAEARAKAEAEAEEEPESAPRTPRAGTSERLRRAIRVPAAMDREKFYPLKSTPGWAISTHARLYCFARDHRASGTFARPYLFGGQMFFKVYAGSKRVNRDVRYLLVEAGLARGWRP